MFKFMFRLLGSAVLFKAGSQLQSFLFKPSDFEKNLERLDQEDWFEELRKDFRYDHIIRYNSKVRKVIGDAKILAKLLASKEEQERFNELVHQEYIKLMEK
ncbi:hypothetical protein SAMN04487975_110130 [Planococcus glaciei]|uniref:hypothetical protein n=1 Tax=Planococcus glaciei TaxID=459472 RepID=UPI00088136A5|nr:hypothetical protein [Planococcus glaciei]SDH98266.1 hypothetical protein SAMN04487975_110130 [Planococcus glaciei]